jgi:hypothetical protein
MIRRIMITLGVLVSVLGANSAEAQASCSRCIYHEPNFLCVSGYQYGHRSCQVTTGGCILEFECGVNLAEDVATSAVQSATGSLARSRADKRLAPVHAVLASGRRVERGCGGKVVARIYDDRTQRALRVKTKHIVV